nr:hypothetical protein [uncultured Gellertiella sp.]
MTGKVQAKRFMAAAPVAAMAATLALVAGCAPENTTFQRGAHSPGIKFFKPAQGSSAPVVSGACPQVSLRDGTSSMRKFARGVKDDPAKLVMQASLAQATRQCTANESGLTITVMAQGRLVEGPQGKPGASYALPIRVAVIEGDKTIYSQLVKFNASLPAGQTTGQFLFSKNDVTVPATTGATSLVFVGFDEGPYNTK